jgi:hypothetical protein
VESLGLPVKVAQLEPSQEELCQTHILHPDKRGSAVWSLENEQIEAEQAPPPDLLHQNAS